MAPSFQEDLKAYKSLKLGPFRPHTHDTLEKAREFLNYIERVDSSFSELDINDPERRIKIFSLEEYDLAKLPKRAYQMIGSPGKETIGKNLLKSALCTTKQRNYKTKHGKN